MEIFQYDFFTNALIIGLLIAVACGIIGTLVVSNKLTFMAGGIAHSAYAGIGIAFYLGINVIIGSIIASIVFSVIIGIISLKSKHRTDSIIGIVWAFGMALGIVFIDLTSGYNVDLMSYLFGSIIAISGLDLFITLFLDIIIIVVVFIFYKEIHAISYDSEYAKISGVPVTFMYFILLILTALSVVVLIRIVGLIMVIAMLTIPPIIAEKFTKSMFKMMIISSVLGMILVTTGLFVSVSLDIRPSGTIILTAVLFYIISFIIDYIRKRK